MYRIEKGFKFPMGHRLSKHKGACFNIHGHNYTVLVGMISPELNSNDMVIDFGDLKTFIKGYLDDLDHCLLINSADKKLQKIASEFNFYHKIIPYDPTAERMSEIIFDYIDRNISMLRKDSGNEKLMVEYVTVFETDGSKATFSRKI
ncbi:MAG: 6-carboxytetrahydropterin synthase [Candidatus Thorarchaeota archaeon]|jgi:6-pyruvoyltetrahydropterin/6-carboxytetrahydropterin synthase